MCADPTRLRCVLTKVVTADCRHVPERLRGTAQDFGGALLSRALARYLATLLEYLEAVKVRGVTG